MITYNAQEKYFHLSNDLISYILYVEEDNVLAHQYFGEKLAHFNQVKAYPRVDRSFSPNAYHATDRLFSKDTVMSEYSSFGSGDYRNTAIKLRQPTGSSVTDFRYYGHRIEQGKPALAGLPHVHGDSFETLVIQMVDAQIPDVYLELSYSIEKNSAAIIRSAKLTNQGVDTLTIEKFASLQLDLADADYEVISLPGSWARERELVREPLNRGTKEFISNRGSSSHQQNPFIALVKKQTTEVVGEAIGVSFVYSGSFSMALEHDQNNQLRVMVGLNPNNFQWQLAPNQEFQTPEVVLTYTKQGLNEMSQTFHQLYKNHLLRGIHRKADRPILVNNWEGTYFDFNEEKINALIDEASELGIELFVLDDGWFGKRNDDKTSLGDWRLNHEKLPNGLTPLIENANRQGLSFGLWFEPEMISEESDLFKVHPEWVLHVPGREKSRSRDQFVLDFSNPEARDYIYRLMRAVLSENNIAYVKWDMNRHLTEVYSTALPATQQGEIHHRYVLGLYEFLEKLIHEFPNVLFESCSGGGGRFDPGMLYYMPQTWTSDNTDAVARLKIQYATSLVYPIITMGSHVSAVPNHQTNRITSMEMRGNVAMSGIFGYELDLTELSEEEKVIIKAQVQDYKKYRSIIQHGKFYRLLNPFESNQTAWLFVSQDDSEVLVFYFNVLEIASTPVKRLKLTGLNKDSLYEDEKGYVYGGDELMNFGILPDVNKKGDFRSELFYFKEVERN